jgi:hypothetical protein
MTKYVSKFSLYTFLLVIVLLPVGIGFIIGCQGIGLYVDVAILGEPLSGTYQAAATKMITSQNAFEELFFHSLLVVIGDIFGWLAIAIAVTLFAMWRRRISRIFCVILVVLFPAVELIFTFPNVGAEVTVLLARCLAVGFAFCALTILIRAIWKIRAFRDVETRQTFQTRGVLVHSFEIVIAILTLFVSASGWKMFQLK